MRLLVIVVVAVLFVACADPSTPTSVPSSTPTVTPSPVPATPVFIRTATVTPIPAPSPPLTDTPPTPVPSPTPDPATATPAPPPDLVIELASVSDSSPRTGQFLTLDATVRNRGGPSNPTTLRYYRSTDPTVTSDDTEVGTDRVSELNSSDSSAESTLTYAPSTPGAYYFGACVEPVSGESDMTNNCSAVLASTVRPPETQEPLDILRDPSSVEECLGSIGLIMGEDYARRVLAHPLLSGGISDTNAWFVLGLCSTVVYAPNAKNIDSLHRLVDPAQMYLQERTIVLPLAGETTLIVVRLTPDAPRTMDIVEELVRQQEGLMDVPYPLDVVAIWNFDEHNVGDLWGPPGTNDSGTIRVSTRYEEERWLLAHELAHNYWSVPSGWGGRTPEKSGGYIAPFNWIIEGGATFLEEYATANLMSAPFLPFAADCNLADSIGELDRKTFDGTIIGLGPSALYRSGCSYTMGLGIFAGLYNRLGDTEFRRGFGSLYLKMISLEHHEECTWESRGLCYMRKAFVEDASPGFAEAAGEVIDLWFHGK